MLARSQRILLPASNNAESQAPGNVRVVIHVDDAGLRKLAERLAGGLTSAEIAFSPENAEPGQRSNRNGWPDSPNRHARPGRDITVRRVIVGAAVDATGMVNAVMSGAWAVIPANAETLESCLCTVVEEVAAGICPLMREIAARPPAASLLFSRLAAAKGSPERKNLPSPLTAMEAEILLRISHGHTSRRIADDMGFQLQTVKNKVTAILNKTGARTRGQAAAVAQANGWIGVR